MMKHKQGASMLISFVLLIGFAIALSVLVGNWVKDQTETITEDIVEDVEGDYRCSQISLQSVLNTACNPTSNTELEITNKGYFKVDAVKIRTEQTSQLHELTNLVPQQAEILYIQGAEDSITIIPVITVDGKRIGCGDRQTTITC